MRPQQSQSLAGGGGSRQHHVSLTLCRTFALQLLPGFMDHAQDEVEDVSKMTFWPEQAPHDAPQMAASSAAPPPVFCAAIWM
jgi:hypothetical protein